MFLKDCSRTSIILSSPKGGLGGWEEGRLPPEKKRELLNYIYIYICMSIVPTRNAFLYNKTTFNKGKKPKHTF